MGWPTAQADAAANHFSSAVKPACSNCLSPVWAWVKRVRCGVDAGRAVHLFQRQIHSGFTLHGRTDGLR